MATLGTKSLWLLLVLLIAVPVKADRRGLLLTAKPPAAGGGGPKIPTDLSGLTGWWKTDALLTNAADSTSINSGDKIKGWGDSSGNNKTLFQPTDGSRGVATNSLRNGLAGVYFTGSTWMDVGFVAPQANTTVFALIQFPLAAGSFGFVFDSTNSAARQAGLKISSSEVMEIFSGGTGRDDATTRSAGAWLIVCWKFDSAGNDVMRVNGTTVVSGLDSGSQSLDGLTLGARYLHDLSWGGAIVELFMFNRVTNSTEDTDMETYLNSAGRGNGVF